MQARDQYGDDQHGDEQHDDRQHGDDDQNKGLRDNDPTQVATSTRVRDQPSLTTSSGRSWLLLGGLLTLISLGVMVPMLVLEPIGVALIGIIIVVVLYAAMLFYQRLADRRQRLALLAGLMIGIAGVALLTVGVVAATQANLIG